MRYTLKDDRKIMAQISTIIEDRVDTLSAEETAIFNEFKALCEIFEIDADAIREKSKMTMRKFRSTEEGRERSRKIARESARRRKAEKQKELNK